MLNPNPPPENQPPQVLSYSPPSDKPSGGRILLRTLLVLLGIAIGIAANALLGVWIWGLAGYNLNQEPPKRPIWPTILFSAFFIASALGFIFVWRKSPRGAKWLLMGLLLGAGGWSLIEGICFMTA